MPIAFRNHDDERFAIIKHKAAAGFGHLDFIAHMQRLGQFCRKSAAVVIENLDRDAAAFVRRAATGVGTRLEAFKTKRHALTGTEGRHQLAVPASA